MKYKQSHRGTEAQRPRDDAPSVSLRLRGCVLVFLLSVSATAARADDLLQVWAQARAADPVLRQAAALSGAQEAGAREARAALLPQWQLQGSELRESGGARWNVATSSLSQTL